MRTLPRILSLAGVTASLVLGGVVASAPASAAPIGIGALTGVTDGATYDSPPSPGCMWGDTLAVVDSPVVNGSYTETATCTFYFMFMPGFPMWSFPEGSATYTITTLAPPVIRVPADIVVTATSAAGATVSFDVTGSGDTTVCDHDPGVFPIGTTTVTCHSDNAASLAVGEFDVKVVDPAAVTLTVPKTIKKSVASAKATVAVTFAVSASDSLDGALVPTCNHASGSSFKVGNTTVTCTATNTRGATVTKKFHVVVSVKKH